MRASAQLKCCLLLLFVSGFTAGAGSVHHYVFFNRDREKISDPAFLTTKAFDGAQLKYTWRELELQKDAYDFSDIESDLRFLQSKRKRLFIQLQDASFSTNYILVPRYLLADPRYHGGADLQYTIQRDDELHVTPQGWVARRWDPAVQERFHKLLFALGRQFDGQIEGINLPETAVDFGESGKLFPKGFTPEIYRDAVITNMAILKRAFPRSLAMQYANFMTGGPNYLRSVYEKASELKVGVGGPDLLPYKPGQMQNSYPLLREYAGTVRTGVAVQEGNYQHRYPNTGQRVTISGLIEFATDYLKVEYIFWSAEEPFFSKDLVPFLQKQR